MKYLFIIFCLLFLLLPVSTKAEDTQHFSITGNFTYELLDNGTLKVREEVKIKNLTTENYAPSFVFDTTGFNPQDVSVYENGIASKTTQKDNNSYEVVFKRPAIGKDSNKTVTILFSDSSLAVKHGTVTEIKIPRVQNSSQFKDLNTIIRVSLEASKSFHIFPKVEGVQKNSIVEYLVSANDSNNGSVTAFLGNIAAYDFTLKYPFTNNSFFTREVSFALPPDTAYQKVYIHDFSQKPDSLTYDSDGNWIGKLTLKPRESKPFNVSGVVFVYADAQEGFPMSNRDSLKLNLIPQKYWESSNPKIIELANQLKTPKAIYDYVVNNLTYDYTKTARPQERLGALTTLGKSNEAICMEFTDLFIALSRAAGIPAREINGFAVSNDDSRPRDLGEDILHSWPEYWNESTKLWTPVDPTWGNTTGGVDYFSHFDLNHIAFVVHGASSTLPQTPGTYETQNTDNELIQVNPSIDGEIESTKPPEITISKNAFSLWEQTYTIVVKNKSGQAIYKSPISVYADDTLLLQKEIISILPFSEFSFPVKIYPGFFGNKLPTVLMVKSTNLSETVTISKFVVFILHFFVLLVPIILVPVVSIYFLKKHAKH